MSKFRPAQRVALGLSSAIAIAFAATPAFAQDAAAATAEEEAGIADIIVTAQRRDENLQDVPVAVTAANAEMLADAGITNVTNLNNLSPSIAFRSANIASSTASVQIRGIGTVGNARTFEGAVGIFIDGVYRTRAGQALSNFLDVDGLQILRGPQGTLFGRNASAGIINITTARPNLNKFSGFGDATYGNYNFYRFAAGVTGPLMDGLAFRLDGVYQHRRGFLVGVLQHLITADGLVALGRLAKRDALAMGEAVIERMALEEDRRLGGDRVQRHAQGGEGLAIG